MAARRLGVHFASVVACLALAWLCPMPAATAQTTRPPTEQERAALQKLNDEVYALNDQGDWRKALPLAEKLLAMRRRHFAEASFDVAASKNSLAFALAKSGDQQKALPLYREALRDIEKIKGVEALETTLVRVNFADTCAGLGRYSEALEHYEKGLAVRRKTVGEDHLQTANMYNSVGFCRYQLGDYAVARSHFDRAIAITRKSPDTMGRTLAQSLNNLGSLLQVQGNAAAAIPVYREAIDIALKVYGDRDDITASLHNNLGSIYREQGDFVKARESFEKALAIREKTLGREHMLYSVVLGNLAGVQNDLKDYDNARAGFERSLAIQRKSVGNEHPVVAQTIHFIARIHGHQKNYDEARTLYDESIRVHLKTLGQTHPDTIDTRWGLARVELLAGQHAAGLKQIDQARRAARAHVARVLPGLSDREQLLFINKIESPHLREALANAFVRHTRPDWCDASAAWLVNGKAIVQETLAEREQLLRAAAGEQASPEVKKLLDVRKRLAAISMGAGGASGGKLQRDDIETLESEESQLTRIVQQQLRRSPSRGEWRELSQIRSAIPDGTALIDIARFYSSGLGAESSTKRTRYAAWIIPPAGQGAVRIIDLGDAAGVETAIRSVREQLISAAKSGSSLRTQGEAESVKELQPAMEQLRKQVWDPLAAALPEGTSQLILCPDGELWLLPWSALPLAEDRCLIEDYSLRFVTSGREVLSADSSAGLSTTMPVLFADPDFDLSVDAVRKAIQAVFPKRTLGPNETRGVLSSAVISTVLRLPNTRTEAEFISHSIEKLTGTAPRLYADRFALESILKSVRRPQMLVLSTHGFFLPRVGSSGSAALDNPLLQCGLLFAGCNSKQSVAGDDGILTGLEIVGIDLVGTQLVVLSACETGVGKINVGEGVAGLRQAFQLAGAKSVVATLWQVPDRDSALLMNEFFANLAAGQSKSEALQHAQRSRISARRERYGAAHPFFWAAWTVTGQ